VGITGERAQIPPQLLEQLHWLKSQTDLPLCVGFGISRPEHVRLLRDAADGIIVGSALVRHLEQVGSKSEEAVIQEIGAQATLLMDALN
jgi:tryptophan synthase alpha chain